MASVAGVRIEGDPLVRGQRLAGSAVKARSSAGPLALDRRNERMGPSVAGGMVAHARRGVRVLVDLKASAELGILSPQPFDLPSPLLGGAVPFLLFFHGLALDTAMRVSLLRSERGRIPTLRWRRTYPQTVRLLGSVNTYPQRNEGLYSEHTHHLRDVLTLWWSHESIAFHLARSVGRTKA